MDPSTGVSAVQAARDEELRGECAKAFEHYKKGNLTRGTKLLQKLLARHPAHPLLHFAYVRLSHKQALAERQPAGDSNPLRECHARTAAALRACPGASLFWALLGAQIYYDAPPSDGVDGFLTTLRDRAAGEAASPLVADDFELAKAIATFDKDALLFLPDVRECADSAAYQTQALANLTKAPAMIADLHRAAGNLARRHPGQPPLWDHFMRLRDARHASEAARRLRRAQARAREEEADRALAAVQRVIAGEGAAHDLQEAAAGWRESADQGDAVAQLLIGALHARGGGGVKKILPLGKRYLQLSAAAGNEDAVALLKELRKCVYCGTLDVHHMICSRCRNVRYCDVVCQLQHWSRPTDPHTLHCVMRRESAGAGGSSSERGEPSSETDQCSAASAVAAAAVAATVATAVEEEAESAAEVAAAAAVVTAVAATVAVAVTEAKAATAAMLTTPAGKTKKGTLEARMQEAPATAQAAVIAARHVVVGETAALHAVIVAGKKAAAAAAAGVKNK